jgi:biopolymer transport protein ExbD
MRNTRRIRRMSRNRTKIPKMNLTSLMDVFTILVFFLLVNTGSVELLEAPKTVVLPESKVTTKPRETIVIFISPDEVLVQGKPVALVANILDDNMATVDAGASHRAPRSPLPAPCADAHGSPAPDARPAASARCSPPCP